MQRRIISPLIPYIPVKVTRHAGFPIYTENTLLSHSEVGFHPLHLNLFQYRQSDIQKRFLLNQDNKIFSWVFQCDIYKIQPRV